MARPQVDPAQPQGLHPDYPELLPPPSDPKDAKAHKRQWLPVKRGKPSPRTVAYNKGRG